ncbi:MAG: radical SAM family heme chaperone HemW [Ferrovibrio sp.]|uniref:radical SAM family heme chaperone HemW n=1 Tax=Ferrovibrio sp. TaxID=1917215 RepID=UPI00261F3AEA|nr:radical SAM family heme chaperone HemW [Ferrovibrio sp.]MCW0235966.1 radical SAM family heme chaperone HemW [Ferrovibrio sp.]
MPVSAEQQAIPRRGFGLYVHWPFCVSKCPYCDFNSHVRERVDAARWQQAYLIEMAHYAAAGVGQGETITSVFFGGGTPSLMPPATAAAILDAAGRHWHFADDVEITLEANPNSAEAGKFAAFAAAGINRLSIGVQSFDAEVLKFLGRAHDAGEARRAIEAAAKAVPRYSFDLIYARPGQTAQSWRAELQDALSLAGDHLSLYTLTIEPNTGFAGAVARGVLQPMPSDDQAALYDLTQGILGQAGMPAYEISNHAKPGGESRHNLVYWRSGSYLGLGPGAHMRLQQPGGWQAMQNRRKPEAWLEQVESDSHGRESATPVSNAERAEEALMMGLRLAEGVYTGNFRAATGLDLEVFVPAERSAPLEAAGLLVRNPDKIVATREGRAVLDGLLARLLA